MTHEQRRNTNWRVPPPHAPARHHPRLALQCVQFRTVRRVRAGAGRPRTGPETHQRMALAGLEGCPAGWAVTNFNLAVRLDETEPLRLDAERHVELRAVVGRPHISSTLSTRRYADRGRSLHRTQPRCNRFRPQGRAPTPTGPRGRGRIRPKKCAAILSAPDSATHKETACPRPH